MASEIRVEQMAPHSVEAEAALIGAVLIDEAALLDIHPPIKPEQFFIVRHGWIWEAILNIHERRDPVDYITVVSELDQMGYIEEVGGAGYVLGLVSQTETALHASGYANIVRRMATRRALLTAASGIARAAHSEETDIDRVKAESKRQLDAALGFDEGAPRLKTRKESMADHYDEVMARQRGELGNRVPSGYRDIDALFGGGLRNGGLIVVAARPGMGKSAWLQGMMDYCSQQGITTGMLSLEMGHYEINTRSIAALTGLTFNQIDRKMSDKHLAQYLEALSIVSEWPSVIDDTANMPIELARDTVRIMVHRNGIKALFVDYLQLLTAPEKRGDVEEITAISKRLKTLARELQIPVIAAAQLSRAPEGRIDKRPLLSDLRGSGAIEQDSDVVMFLYRDQYYNTETGDPASGEVIVAKNRQGDTGIIHMAWDGPGMRWHDLAREETYEQAQL